MTTSRPGAATYMRVRVKPSHAPQSIFMLDALPAAIIPISWLKTCTECGLAYPEVRLYDQKATSKYRL